MKRRKFINKSCCALAGIAAVPFVLGNDAKAETQSIPKYEIEIEIYEAREDTWCHKKGDRFKYPEDWGKVCPWFRASMIEFIRILEYGGTLTWNYPEPYQKVIDQNGLTTEFVRCPDPTADLVAKIIRTKVS